MQHSTLHHAIAEAPTYGAACWVQTADQVRLRVASWVPDVVAHGTVFIFPGRTEYIEKYGRTITELTARGCSALAIDWRGQGASDRIAKDPFVGHVRAFSDYQLDVAAMIKAAEGLDLPRPWYVIGHSMGGLIALRALQHTDLFAACAFTAPMWRIKLSRLERAVLWPVTWAAATSGRGAHFVPGNTAQQTQCYVQSVGFEENRLTRDAEMFGYMQRQAQTLPDFQTGAPSYAWVREALKECRAVSGLTLPKLPCAAFCGDADVLVDASVISTRMQNWPFGTFKLIPNARHDLLSEPPAIRREIIDTICALFAQAS